MNLLWTQGTSKSRKILRLWMWPEAPGLCLYNLTVEFLSPNSISQLVAEWWMTRGKISFLRCIAYIIHLTTAAFAEGREGARREVMIKATAPNFQVMLYLQP